MRHQPLLMEYVHEPLPLQMSVVQDLPSLQTNGVARQVPLEQWSFQVHGWPSEHARASSLVH